MSWGYEKLSIIAPSKPLKHPVISNSEKVWMLNLDMVEANSGQVIGKQKSPLSTAGSSTHWFDTSHVLYSKLRPYLNKVVMPDEEGLATTELVPLKPDSKRLDRAYLTYYLRSKTFVDWISEQVAGAKMPRVSMNVFWNHEIPIPFPDDPAKSLAEQKRIASILDKADAIRRKRKQAIQLADDFLRSVFLDMFGDPLVNSKKWQVQNLGELTTKITDGKHGDCEDEIGSGYYFISAKDVNHGRINYENTRQINKKEFDEVHRRTDLQAGDLVMVNTGATIGRVAIVMNDEKTSKTTFQKSVAIIKPKGDLLNSNFLKYIFLLRVKDFASVGSGSAIKNLLLSKMREFPIIVPPMELQCKFDRIVSHIESSSIRDAADSELNDELFNSLSQKAFAGEL
ncbi:MULTISPECIES: restriction endonuclease subunit S [unclassified Shewanella]|uniref:restriction endonuclease subunit S n=1 Tax=Shewanella TaxID=22 RepID=UPI0021D97AEF|nr:MULTISPECIES: restriction endonuclease subunit S [unclassified Shewanella]MCU7997415.1 restriction endonuclease subunit S [Shewanella sp. SM95]MCU8028764.1 restriction endonuclease subunit S [Shewanella sp. SM73]